MNHRFCEARNLIAANFEDDADCWVSSGKLFSSRRQVGFFGSAGSGGTAKRQMGRNQVPMSKQTRTKRFEFIKCNSYLGEEQ
jgi:hypothetical protein